MKKFFIILLTSIMVFERANSPIIAYDNIETNDTLDYRFTNGSKTFEQVEKKDSQDIDKTNENELNNANIEKDSLANNEEIIVTDNIISDVNWSDDGTVYALQSDIRIKNGASLIIGKGVTVNGNGYTIYNYGTLDVEGSILNNTNIGIGNINGQDCYVTMNNSEMNYGSLLNRTDNNCTTSSAILKLYNNHLNNLYGNINIHYPHEDIYVSNNVFENCGCFVIHSYSGYTIHINNNAFHGTGQAIKACYNTQCILDKNSFYFKPYTDCILQLEYQASIAAANNFWNTTDESIIRSKIIDGNNDFTVTNTIEFVPVLEAPDEATPPVNHSFCEWNTVAVPTCLKSGWRERSCTICGAIETEVINALGHDYSTEWIIDKAATCTETGIKSHHCTRCNEKTDVTEIPMIDHTWDEGKVTTEPTCTTAGVKTFTCAVCGAAMTETMEALGHDYSTEWTIDKEATCSEVGSKSHHCTRCDEKTDVTEIPMTDHVWDEGKVTTEATCTTAGVRTFTCTACGTTRNEEIKALGHNYSTEWTIDKEATCTEAGSKSHHCTRCDEKTDVTEIVDGKVNLPPHGKQFFLRTVRTFFSAW